MVADSSFQIVNARLVARADGTQVEFVNAHELEYRKAGRTIRLEAERHIAADGAPDGRDIVLPSQASWLDGAPLLENERSILINDLLEAAPALRTKLRIVGV